ncbi:hypothetical protein MLD38_013792 [Melastoma candidum]|uniref:Uncharacterized protein n=1 Tax=Melastoma candidum TaxID=119954 RepID=A0ACB9RAB9_9MYRT|nr:hypothetical protein MLD38_013792 [Melastoma candidum]
MWEDAWRGIGGCSPPICIFRNNMDLVTLEAAKDYYFILEPHCKHSDGRWTTYPYMHQLTGQVGIGPINFKILCLILFGKQCEEFLERRGRLSVSSKKSGKWHQASMDKKGYSGDHRNGNQSKKGIMEWSWTENWKSVERGNSL